MTKMMTMASAATKEEETVVTARLDRAGAEEDDAGLDGGGEEYGSGKGVEDGVILAMTAAPSACRQRCVKRQQCFERLQG
jgi:hypothetical protein